MGKIINRIAQAGGVEHVAQRADGNWIEAPAGDPGAYAQVMKDLHVRLSTVTALARQDGESDLIYHYFLPKMPINIRITTRGQALPSIASILPAASWIEREIHDLYSVNFVGHPDLRRLVRPPEMPEGFFRQPGGAASKERTA